MRAMKVEVVIFFLHFYNKDFLACAQGLPFLPVPGPWRAEGLRLMGRGFTDAVPSVVASDPSNLWPFPALGCPTAGHS